ncbi:hypothetical protein SAMD00019534_087190, partial [Acytostelium subglobosum LB1]|uniref:hypothetical protein n=1 Tax=Acytostelium subglobosum LB1 TaxID=1410327 RepID=UPI000644FD06
TNRMSINKQQTTQNVINAPDTNNADLNKLKSSLSARAMARRSVALNSSQLLSQLAAEGASKEEPVPGLKGSPKTSSSSSSSSTTTSTTTTITKEKTVDKDTGSVTTTTTSTTTHQQQQQQVKPTKSTSSENSTSNLSSSFSNIAFPPSGIPKKAGTLKSGSFFVPSSSTKDSNNTNNNNNTNNSAITTSSTGVGGGGGDEVPQIKHTASSLQKMKTFDTTRKRSQSISSGCFVSSPNLKPQLTSPSIVIDKSTNNSKQPTIAITTTTADEQQSNGTADTDQSQAPAAAVAGAAADTPKPKPKEDVFTRLSSLAKPNRSRSQSVSANHASAPSPSSTSSDSKDSSKLSKLLPKALRSSKADLSPTSSSSSSSKDTTSTTTKSTASSKESSAHSTKTAQPPVPSKVSPVKSPTTISTNTDPSTHSISLTSSPNKLANFKCTMTPSVALKLYANELTKEEKVEIMDFPNIYFTGNTIHKTKINRNLPNNGFDREQGDYVVVEHDHIAYRYEILSILGHGSFCQVVKCHDHKTGQLVAVKIIRNQKRFHSQALTEIKILEFLKNNDPNSTANIVHLNESFEFRNHLCITFELLSMNLYDFLKANNFQGFNINLIRRFAAQLLTSLRFLSKRHIIHADLKPENILLKQPTKSGIKLIDFGSSCFENEPIFTYIQSRFYRAPEVILGIRYEKAIDIWSLGCILAELYMGAPLFPGSDEPEQLACIIEIYGVPPASIIQASTRREVFFDDAGAPLPYDHPMGGVYGVATKTLAESMKSQDEDFVDFIDRCLQWDPNARLTPEEGLRHRFVAELANTATTAAAPTSTT